MDGLLPCSPYRRLAAKFVDAVSCNGRLSSDYTCSLGVSEDRITLDHMAADTDGLRGQLETVTADAIESLHRSLGVEGVMFLSVGQLKKKGNSGTP